MLKDGKIYAGRTADGREIGILPSMANRHGFIAGATGTGKTVTLKVLAESFSDLGVPVFLADVKGDLAGMLKPGVDSESMRDRIAKFQLADTGFHYQAYPTEFFDIYGQNGIQLRTTISDMGPVLLSRILGLNDIQSQILSIAFKIADDNQLLLIDTKDLKAMLNWLDDHKADFKQNYGNVSTSSIAAITRAIITLEMDGGDSFFGEPALNITDLFQRSADGRGIINILDSESLINHPSLYSTFLLWLLSELFEKLPEVGDMDKPKMVFFFDEAHLLFDDASKELLQKITQVVRLIRSKGIGIYFVTQNPGDIPDDVLSQLGNKIEHGLRAYSPNEQKKVKAAAYSFRPNPQFDTFNTILNLATAEAVVSFLDENGTPEEAEKVSILPPQSKMGAISDDDRQKAIKGSLLYTKYANAVDPDSAYEVLERRGAQEAAAAEQAARDAEVAKQQAEAEKQRQKEEAARAKQEAQERKQREKELAAAEKQRQKEEVRRARDEEAAARAWEREQAEREAREARARERAAKDLAGSFGRALGGNTGARLARGLMSTLLRY
jgi:DNA helicase HerA-like ATPase